MNTRTTKYTSKMIRRLFDKNVETQNQAR